MTETKPFLSGICLTYARPKLLEEAIESFLRQDYDGPKELIVLNTFPLQQITGDFPNVKIFNLDKRPSALGAARNLAIAQASGDFILTWDDDDVCLPWHMRNYAEALKAGPALEWLSLSNSFYAERFAIRDIKGGVLGTFAFSKRAWESVGGYDPQTSFGEDKQFSVKVTSQFAGKVVSIPLERISYILGWGNDALHISGYGRPKQGQASGYELIEARMKRLVASGKLKGGKIVLRPQWRHDWIAQARRIVAAQSGNACATASAPVQHAIPIYHAVERHSAIGAREQVRKGAAWRSWQLLYRDHGVIPVHYSEYGRDSRTIGDSRQLPFFRDVLQAGLNAAKGPEDIILWTNDDTILHPDVASLLRKHLSQHQAVTAIRCEFQSHKEARLTLTPQQWRDRTIRHKASGRDLFAATRQWLEGHFDRIGDYILGAPLFDYFIAELVREYHGIKDPHKLMGAILAPAELPMGYVGHVAHNPKWTSLETKSNEHNRSLYDMWKSRRDVTYPEYGELAPFDENTLASLG